MRGLGLIIISLCLNVGLGSEAYAWGKLGHQAIGEVGAKLTGSRTFWAANYKNVGFLSNVPDWYWKSTTTAAKEKPTHYFEPDGFMRRVSDFHNFPKKWSAAVEKYGEEALVKHGTAIWRIQQLYGMAVNKIRRGDFETATQYAGTMAHYVEDISQPLHVTVNYDGQMTEQTGIHAFFESTNLNARDIEVVKEDITEAALKIMPTEIPDSISVEEVIFDSVIRSYQEMDNLLAMDKSKGRGEEGKKAMYKLAVERMADGAVILSVLLRQMWKDAGSPANGRSVTVEVPEWVAPDYSRLGAKSMDAKSISFFPMAKQSDCE